jgi:hypothetical protein
MTVINPTFTYTDTGRTASLNGISSITPSQGDMTELLTTVRDLDLLSPVASVVTSGFDATVTLADARSFTITVVPGAPVKFTFASSGSFTQDEVTKLRGICNLLNRWLGQYGLTQLEIAYP